MCGRFEFSLKDDKKGKQIKERAEKLNLVYKEGEIFPTDQVLCIIPVENKIDLSVMKWGINNKSLLINARMESINDRPSYKEIKNNRLNGQHPLFWIYIFEIKETEAIIKTLYKIYLK